MKKITTAIELKERIGELEVVRDVEKAELKKQLHEIRESLKPANIIKNTIKEVAVAPGIKTKFIGALLGLAAGYLAKKAVFGSTTNPLKKMAGSLIQMGLAGTISRNTDSLQAIGGDLLNRILKRVQKKRNGMFKDHQE